MLAGATGPLGPNPGWSFTRKREAADLVLLEVGIERRAGLFVEPDGIGGAGVAQALVGVEERRDRLLPVPVRLEVERCSMERPSVIVSDPEILGGTPCFRGTRVPVDSLIDYLEAGDTLDEFLDNFPSVSREAAIAALEKAKALLTNSR